MSTLDELALQHKTDKASDGHGFASIYETYLAKLRDEPIVIFELGVGGYQYPDRGGESLRMWLDYFPKARILGLDCYVKNGMENDRTVIVRGNQDDRELLLKLVETIGAPDVVVDDASHLCSLTIKSFEIMFPLLKPGGLYFCEDVHTSFWKEYEGDPDPSAPGTTLKFFRHLTPQLSQDTLLPEHRNQYAGYLEYIHFYRNLVVVKKL